MRYSIEPMMEQELQVHEIQLRHVYKKQHTVNQIKQTFELLKMHFGILEVSSILHLLFKQMLTQNC